MGTEIISEPCRSFGNITESRFIGRVADQEMLGSADKNFLSSGLFGEDVYHAGG